MTPAPHQKIIMGKDPMTLASRLPAFWSQRRKMYPLVKQTAAATQQEIQAKAAAVVADYSPVPERQNEAQRRATECCSSKEANLASSRNTAGSQGETHWILCHFSHQQGAAELWGKSDAHAGLGHGPHVVELLFLALERSAQELLHRHARGGPATSPAPRRMAQSPR